MASSEQVVLQHCLRGTRQTTDSMHDAAKLACNLNSCSMSEGNSGCLHATNPTAKPRRRSGWFRLAELQVT